VDLALDLHVTGEDSLVVDVVKALHEAADLYVPNFWMVREIVVAGCHQLQRWLVKHYVQFIPWSEHANWMVEILVVDGWMKIWMIFILALLSYWSGSLW
jgi:hypothetical protein